LAAAVLTFASDVKTHTSTEEENVFGLSVAMIDAITDAEIRRPDQSIFFDVRVRWKIWTAIFQRAHTDGTKDFNSCNNSL